MQARISHVSTVLALLALLLFTAWPTHAQGYQTEFRDWHPNGQWLAISDFQSVKIIEVSSGLVLNEFPHQSGDPFRPGGPLEWSPDGTSLAFTDYQPVYVWSQPWDASQAELVMTYDFNAGQNQPSISETSSVKWSPNGQRLIVHVGELFDVVDGNTGALQYVNGGNFSVNDVVWLNDDRIIVVTRQGYIVTIDAATGEPVNYLGDLFDSLSPSNFQSIALSPDAQQAVVGSSEGEIIVWNDTSDRELPYQSAVTTWQYETDHINGVNDLAWSPSGQYVAASFRNGSVSLYDAASGEQLVSLSLGGETANNALAWSPEGSQLAYGLPDGGYALFDASTLPGYVPMETAEVSS